MPHLAAPAQHTLTLLRSSRTRSDLHRLALSIRAAFYTIALRQSPLHAEDGHPESRSD